MVALNAKFHDPAARPGLQGTGVGRACRSWELGDISTDQGRLITDRKYGFPVLFIDHYSLVIERSASANEIIICGYPDRPGFRGLDDASPQCRCLATPLNQHDPEAELYYVRNRTYSSIPGTVLRQEPKSRKATGVATRVLQRDPIGYAGGINLYEYVGGRAVAGADASGLAIVTATDTFHAGFWATFHVVVRENKVCPSPSAQIVAHYWTGFTTVPGGHFSAVVIPCTPIVTASPCADGTQIITYTLIYEVKILDTIGVWKFGFTKVVGSIFHGDTFQVRCNCCN